MKKHVFRELSSVPAISYCARHL